MDKFKMKNNIMIKLTKKFIINFLLFNSFWITPAIFAENTLNISDEKNDFSSYIRKKFNDSFYILGPGDTIAIKVGFEKTDIDGFFMIDGQGEINLKRLNKIYVSGLTVDELTKTLNKEYEKFLIDPQVKISVLKYRPIKIYINGEVNNPGFHVLPGTLSTFYGINEIEAQDNKRRKLPDLTFKTQQERLQILKIENRFEGIGPDVYFPTLSDVLREAGGLSIYSKLDNIQVIRKNSFSNGGGLIKTDIDFLEVINMQDLSKNIRIMDGDIIRVSKSDSPNLQSISNAIKTNINPKYINILVAGRVERNGLLKLSSSSTLVEAVDIAEPRVLKGKVNFLRYNSDGSVDSRIFKFNRNALRGSYKNPLLQDGDVLIVRKSILNKSTEAILDLTNPIRGLFNVYALKELINN